MSEKQCKVTKIARLEDPLNDVRNLFESEYSHQSGVGTKKDEREAPDNDRVSAPTSYDLFHYYQNKTNIKNDYSNDKDESQVSTYHQKPVGIDRHNEIDMIKRKKKAETYHQNIDQNYRSCGFEPCYKNELELKINMIKEN